MNVYRDIQMKHLKQKILFLLYFRQTTSSQHNLKNEDTYVSYNFLYKLVSGVTDAAVRKAIGELCDKGDVDKIIRNNQSYFRLTLLGAKETKKLFPNFFYQAQSRKGWYLAIIKSGKKARQTRIDLENIGFAGICRGVYICPVGANMESKISGMTSDAYFFGCPKLNHIDEKSLVGKLYNLDKFVSNTQAVIKQTNQLLAKIEDKITLENKEIKQISSMAENMFILIKNTIGLPKNLLPADWPLPRAAWLFSKVIKKMN